MPAKTEDKAPARKGQDGPNSGVLAPGAVGKAAREAAHEAATAISGNVPEWDRKGAKYADDDQSIDARMWRLKRDHEAMGSR